VAKSKKASAKKAKKTSTKKSKAAPAKQGTGSATPLDGYMYQLEVSVWAALDLLVAKRMASEITLEPASKEDLETDIVDEPGALAETVQMDNHRLVIQCKLRTTGPWKTGTLNSLLAHGTQRQSAKLRLADPKIRYLLVTNADVDQGAREMMVSDLGALWPLTLPKAISDALPTDAVGRVAIFSSMDFERLKSRTEKMLTERFRIPMPKLSACQKQLQEDALARMRGVGKGIWSRNEIEKVLISFGGYVGESAALEGFVEPTNWEDMVTQLDTQNAVIISGASGTGKTRAAKALVEQLRGKLPGLTVIQVQGGPDRILNDVTAPPVVFEIEDPWGRFRLEPTSAPWNDRISTLLATAGPDRKFVITSRSDVLKESGPSKLSQKWLVPLEEENYEARQRIALFEHLLVALPPTLQAIVVKYQKEAVDRLKIPLEMQRYFDVLMDGRLEKENERQFVERCLAEASQGTIESAILNNVKKREDWPLAAAVWGLFKSRAMQSFANIPAMQAGLTARDRTLEDRLEPYINFLIAGRNLRQNGVALTYHHPRVELGLEQALLEKPEQSGRILRYLVETLIDQDTRNNNDWGREGAARIVEAAASLPKIQLNLTQPVRTQLDDWLKDRLLSASPEFEDDLRLAAMAASSDSAAGELARWLTNKPRDRNAWFSSSWSLAQKPDAWYARLRADPAIKPICETFIRNFLTRSRHYYGSGFAGHISRLADNLTPAFQQAALKIVEDGVNPNDDAISTGALVDLKGFEPILDAAIAYEKKLQTNRDRSFWLKLVNGEYDEDAAEHYQDGENEDGYTADSFVKAYVEARRRADGWAAVANHPHAEQMLYAWINTVSRKKDADALEWVGLAKASIGSSHEDRFWELLMEQPNPGMQALLEDRLVQGCDDLDARDAATRLALAQFPAIFGQVAARLMQSSNTTRLYQLTADMGAISRHRHNKQSITAAIANLTTGLSTDLRDAVVAISDTRQKIGAGALTLVSDLQAGTDTRLALAQAHVLNTNGVVEESVLRSVLTSTKGDNDEQLEYSKDAVDLAIQAKAWPIVSGCLSHRFAAVRERALVALAARNPGVLPDALLALASDPGSGVRQALLKLVGERKAPEHRDTLLTLAADTWASYGSYYGQDPSHPIAVGAAELLSEPPPLSDAHIEAIYKVIKRAKDSHVISKLLTALIKNGNSDSRARVMQAALRSGPHHLHTLAANALLRNSEHVEETIGDEIELEHLAKRRASVACPLALVLGATAKPSHALSVAKDIAAVPTRRALVGLIWLALVERDPKTSEKVLKLLPDAFAKSFQKAANKGPKLPRDSLHSLADIRTAEEIMSRLEFMFRMQPKKAAKSGFVKPSN
jgi:hypothetical protein